MPNIRHIPTKEAVLLGAAFDDNKSANTILSSKLTTFRLIASRLTTSNVHEALFLLKNCFSIPKLLYSLRCAACYTSDVLPQYDDIIRLTLKAILNVDLTCHICSQANLIHQLVCDLTTRHFASPYLFALEPLYALHTCVCGQSVDSYGTHGFACRKSAGRLTRHNAVNHLIERTLALANIPALLEPKSLCRDEGKRPDGLSVLPWANSRCLVWDFQILCWQSFESCRAESKCCSK
jgi:hypothetical protein